MHHHWRVVSLAGLLASIGCGGVTMRQESTSEQLGIPRITAERLQACVTDFRDQLPDGSWAFSSEFRYTQTVGLPGSMRAGCLKRHRI